MRLATGKPSGIGRQAPGKNSRKIAPWPLVIAVLIIIAVALFQISAANARSSSAAALNTLNLQIVQYGANVRYLLSVPPSGYSFPTGLHNSSLYNPTYSLSHPLNASSIPALLGLNASTSQQLASSYDWGAHDRSVANTTEAALYSLGVLPSANPSADFSYLSSSTDLESFYLLALIGKNIELIASSAGSMFSSGLFNSYNVSAPSYVGLGAYPSDISTGFLTSTTPTLIFSSAPVLGTAPGWAALFSEVNATFEYDAMRGYAVGNKTVTPFKNILYTMSLDQYQSYQFYETLFNKTINPEMDFIGYSRNTLVLNLGNLNLGNGSAADVRLDNRTLSGTQYLNWFIANVSLQSGLHNVSVSLGSDMLHANLYVSPFMYIESWLLKGDELSVQLGNANYRSYALNVSNINVSAAPPYFDTPAAPLGSATSITPNRGTATHLDLNSYMTAVLNYTVYFSPSSSGTCGAGASYVYYLSFDTNLGKAYYVLPGRCA